MHIDELAACIIRLHSTCGAAPILSNTPAVLALYSRADPTDKITTVKVNSSHSSAQQHPQSHPISRMRSTNFPVGFPCRIEIHRARLCPLIIQLSHQNGIVQSL